LEETYNLRGVTPTGSYYCITIKVGGDL